MVLHKFASLEFRRHRRLPRRNTGSRKFDFCVPPPPPPQVHTRVHPRPPPPPPPPPRRGPRGIHSARAIITPAAVAGRGGGSSKCLTRCSKLHLIQRPRLAKWHIVRAASINGGGGVPFAATAACAVYAANENKPPRLVPRGSGVVGRWAVRLKGRGA